MTTPYGSDMQYGYARTSHLDPNPAEQLQALREAGCDKIFTENSSAGATDRPQLKICLEELKPGDTLTVCKLGQLGGSLGDLVKIGEDFQERGIEFRSLGDKIDTSLPGGKVAFQYFAALAEFQRNRNTERIRPALQAARDRGVKTGAKHKMTAEKIELAQQLIASGEPKKRVAEIFNVTYPTLSRALSTPQPQ
jgi:DNA invertase Pin-like site-specific DNA recombinase